MQLKNSAIVALALLVAGGSAGRLRSAQSTQAQSDPTCRSGVLSAPGKPQVCCASFCGKCSDEPTCKNNHRLLPESDTEGACCTHKIRSLACGAGEQASASFCLKSCDEAAPPCIMDPEKRFTTPAPHMRNAKDDANEVKEQWQTTAENTIKSTSKGMGLPYEISKAEHAEEEMVPIFQPRSPRPPGSMVGLNLLSHLDQGPHFGSKLVEDFQVRPMFRKQVHCIGEDCQDCTGPEDCFFDCNENGEQVSDRNNMNSLCLRAGQASEFTRFVTLVHISCPTAMNMAHVFVWLKEFSAGTFEVRWDGSNVWHVTPEDAINGVWRGRPNLKSDVEGGHTLELNVFRKKGVKSTVTVDKLTVISFVKFQRCLDSHGCLDALESKGPLGIKLRNSNWLLRKCLMKPFEKTKNIPEVGWTCRKWRKCMRQVGGGVEEHMSLLLNAAALGKGDGSKTEASDESCIHPPNEDPMAWNCDCFEEMHNRCLAAGAKNSENLQDCLRAHFCLNKKVCKSWKQAVCPDEKIKTWKKKLKALDSASAFTQSQTMARALENRAANNGSMAVVQRNVDQVASAKKCT